MPFKSDKIIIAKSKYDRRIKLTEQDKQDIREFVGVSIHELARMYGVNKRTIQFIKFPERQKKNIQHRKERGGSKIYYSTEKNRDYQKKHRNYKHKLYTEGKIK